MTHHHDSIVARLAEYRRHFTGEYCSRGGSRRGLDIDAGIVGDNMGQLGMLMPSEGAYYAVTATHGEQQTSLVALKRSGERACIVGSSVCALFGSRGRCGFLAVWGCFGCSRLRWASCSFSLLLFLLCGELTAARFLFLAALFFFLTPLLLGNKSFELGFQGTRLGLLVLEHTAQRCAFFLELRYNLCRLLLRSL